MIEIRLLGQFDIRQDGHLVEIPSRPAQSLLAYLALTAEIAHRRERLAGLLWPDLPETDARRNLRRALWHIRKAVAGQALLRADDITVAFQAGPEVWVDALVTSQKMSAASTMEELTQVVSAYGGELLPGFYDEWIIVERERLHSAFDNRIKLLLDRMLAAQCWEEVLEWGERWIARSGSPEPAYRALMTAYSGLGDLSGVAHAYQRCVEALYRDLGVEPSQETRYLYERLSQPGQASPLAAGGELPIRNGQADKPAGLPEPVDLDETRAQPPFKGLQFFDETDAGLFFGREELSGRLLGRLGIPSGGSSGSEQILVIVGASGSGKSSLARAGLVPAVRREAAQERTGKPAPAWEITVITPSAHPLEALAAGLTRDVESVTAAATLMDDLARDPRSLRLFLHKRPTPLFLVVDQLEELFTLCRDENGRQSFIDNLLEAATGGRCKLVLTLRADFYAHCAQYENLRTALTASQEYIGPMSAAELRRAIEEPAQRNGYEYETGLVDLILREVGAEPGALPLLSHALLETWKRGRGRTLTLGGYAEAGGVNGAIAHTAETVFAHLEPGQQRIARSIFLRLTEFGEGAPDTRRRATPEELAPSPADRRSTTEVLNLLAEARLVTVGKGSVEVAHEALIREWPALRTWLSEDREGLRLHRRLTEAAQGWEELEREPGELYRGARLAQAVEWSAAHPGELNELERSFLAASQAQAEQEAAEREAARLREVKDAQRLAEAEQRRAQEQARTAQRFRWLAAGLAVLLLAAVALASFALQQRDQVRAQARLAISRELAASALTNLDVDPERSILLALQALENARTQEAEDALHQALQASRLLRVYHSRNKWLIGVAASIDGKLAATSIAPETGLLTEVWDRESGERLYELPGGLADDSWPDPSRLATVNAAENGAPVFTFWDARTGQALKTYTLPFPFADSGAGDLSPDWERVAVAMLNGTTRVYELETGEMLLTIGDPGGPPSRGVAFSPDGKSLVTTVNLETAQWDLATGRKLHVLPSASFGAFAVSFSPRMNKVAIGLGLAIKLADSRTGDEDLTLFGRSGQNLGIEFSEDGYYIAAGGSDSKAIVWNSLTGQVQMVLSGHGGEIVESVAFIPWQPRLATVSYDGTVRLWDVAPAGDKEAASFYDLTRKWFTGLAYSPDGARLAVSGGGQAGHVYDALTGSRLLSLHGVYFDSWLGSIAFNPDGSRIASTNGEENVLLWDAGNGKKLLTLAGGASWIGDLAFSPDGSRLAAIAYDGTVTFWDPKSGAELFHVQAFTEQVDTTGNIGLDFSPDGDRFATAGGYQVRIWDADSGKLLLALPAQEDYAFSVAFSPDGKRLAVGIVGGVGAGIWDAASGQKLAELKGVQGSVVGILFSRDGKQVYTGSVDGTVRIWDADTGEERLTLTHQNAQITGLALSPDGTRLAASSSDGTARVFLLQLDDLVDLALHRLTRWFTPEECQEYLHSPTCPERPTG